MYICVTIDLNPPEPASEIFIAALAELGFESFEEKEEGLKAYIRKDQFDRESLDALWVWKSDSWEASMELEEIPLQNWNAVWEADYHPIRVGDQILVRAPFHPPAEPEVPYELVIEPKMSFGTGHHETTWLMLGLLLEEEVTGRSVLDMGCGTGVLAILAARKGADRVMAIDIDPWSVENSLDNARVNGHSDIEVREGDASLLGGESFDLILANINKNILLRDIPDYIRVLKPGGTLILSGFYEADLPDLVRAVGTFGLELSKKRSKNRWVASSFTRP